MQNAKFYQHLFFLCSNFSAFSTSNSHRGTAFDYYKIIIHFPGAESEFFFNEIYERKYIPTGSL